MKKLAYFSILIGFRSHGEEVPVDKYRLYDVGGALSEEFTERPAAEKQRSLFHLASWTRVAESNIVAQIVPEHCDGSGRDDATGWEGRGVRRRFSPSDIN